MVCKALSMHMQTTTKGLHAKIGQNWWQFCQFLEPTISTSCSTTADGRRPLADPRCPIDSLYQTHPLQKRGTLGGHVV